jgi:hypothetical protein
MASDDVLALAAWGPVYPVVAAGLPPRDRCGGLDADASLWAGSQQLSLYGMLLGVAAHLPIVMVVLMLRSQHRRENPPHLAGLDRVDGYRPSSMGMCLQSG